MKPKNIVVILLSIIALFVIGLVLQVLSSVLLPFIIAVFFAILFKPVVDFLTRKKVPMAITLILMLVFFAVCLFLFAVITYSGIQTVASTIPKYQPRMDTLFNQGQGAYQEILKLLNLKASDVKATDIISVSSFSTFLTELAGSFLNFAGTAFVILLFLMFLLGGSGDLTKKILLAFPKDQAEKFARIVENINAQIRSYLVTKTVINALTGIAVAIILFVFGVDFAIFWGILFFFLHYIPNIGSLFGVALIGALSFIEFDSFAKPVIVIVLLTVIQNVIGNVLEPKIMSGSLNLSPVLILLSLFFWGWLWGIWGMVLSVPIITTIKIVCENIEELRFISVLMSGNVKGIKPHTPKVV